jgi:SAM-dependent methyltransferase
MMSKYTTEFFEAHKDGSARSASEVVPMIMSLLRPNTVVDVGCGSGEWLRAFKAHGASVLGIDGFSDVARLDLDHAEFRRLPLDEPLPDSLPKFNLAVALEVAEHLPPQRASTFVQDLVRLAPAVLFSAAIPGQGGTHHVNEQWPDYWAAMFATHGFVCIDALRATLWENHKIDWWYAQNTLLYIHEDRMTSDPALAELRHQRPHRLVHPDNYIRFLNPSPPTVSVATMNLMAAVKRSIKRRLRSIG